MERGAVTSWRRGATAARDGGGRALSLAADGGAGADCFGAGRVSVRYAGAAATLPERYEAASFA